MAIREEAQQVRQQARLSLTWSKERRKAMLSSLSSTKRSYLSATVENRLATQADDFCGLSDGFVGGDAALARSQDLIVRPL